MPVRRTSIRPSTSLSHAIAWALAAGGAMSSAHAQQAFSPAWFAAKGAIQSNTAATGQLPNGAPASSLNRGQRQRQSEAARERLQQSLANFNTAAQAVALQQSLQARAREAASQNATAIPDGLAEGGLKIDQDALTRGWLNASTPEQTVVDGRTTVTIEQTGERAILNWETFNVGRNTTVDFQQQSGWSVLNRVNDPQARPSQIAGQIKAGGTVMIANRNGVVFDGTSQVNTRNLVAAAARITDEQFTGNGLYGADSATPTFTDALGAIDVQAGAQIKTAEPQSVTQGGGYVLLLGTEVNNAGTIDTARGQTAMAAGDTFIIRRGVGTESNTHSTTRGNEIAPVFNADSTAGRVVNTGLVTASEGDITLTGRTIEQRGVLLSTTSVNARGTVHLSTKVSDTESSVTFGADSVTAIVPVDSSETALDSQRASLIEESVEMDASRIAAQIDPGAFDNLSWLSDRRDLSRIEVVSGGTVEFQGGSLTLATGGQVSVASGNRDSTSTPNPGGRVWLAERAQIDVAGAVGVSVSMESNVIEINVQGNEQRDAPANRDTTNLNNSNVWVDRRSLVFVPAGTNGYERDRWYTGGGLLEVGGYLGTTGRGVGEWLAPGGTVLLAGNEVVTQVGSSINLSGGTLDVQSGYINQTWLRGENGQLYEVSRAPGDLLYTGLYRGFEEIHARWGDAATRVFHSPVIAPSRRLESGYTVGLDAGTLRIEAPAAILEGALIAQAHRGERQVQGRPAGNVPVGTSLPQDVAPLRGRLELRTGVIGPHDISSGMTPPAEVDVRIDDVSSVTEGMSLTDALAAVLPPERAGNIAIDADWINAQSLGGLSVEGSGQIDFLQDLRLADGGELTAVAPFVDVAADIVAPGGRITLTNITESGRSNGIPLLLTHEGTSEMRLRDGATLDVSGRWVNQWLGVDVESSLPESLAWLDGGQVKIETTGGIVLEAGSVIDVSSGGAWLSDGISTLGGRGGDLTLITGAYGAFEGIVAGELVLDTELRAVGMNGGGTLTIEAEGVVSVGGDPLLADGVLSAGETALVDLILAEDLLIPAGSVLDSALSYTSTRLAPGEIVTEPITPAVPFVVQDSWTVPAGMYVYGPGFEFFRPGSVVPPGKQIVLIENSLPVGYQIPANVFPDGIPTPPRTTVVPAGTPTTMDITLYAGTSLGSGRSLPVAAAVERPAHLDTSMFQTGFSHYSIGGDTGGVAVNDGAQLQVTMPVYRIRPEARGIATDAPPEQVFETWLPPLYMEDPQQGVLTQRRGASLSLISERDNVGGSLYIGRDALVEVDPGQSILLQSRGQITIDGALRAPGGDIVVQLSPENVPLERDWTEMQFPGSPDHSIWIGETAHLDAAARAVTAADALGRPYGIVPDGGNIYLGGNRELGWGADAFVVVRPGAVLDASGAHASIVVPGAAELGAIGVASDGGSITLASFNGLYLDGTVRAAAGGAGAAGGTLGMEMDVRSYYGIPGVTRTTPPDDVIEAARDFLTPRELIVSETARASELSEEVQPGDGDSLTFGHARLGLDQFEQGGFGALDLSAPLIGFEGNLTLSAAQRISLTANALVPVGIDDNITVRAPYVRLAGLTTVGPPYSETGANEMRSNLLWGSSLETGAARIAFEGDLIDVEDAVRFGARAYNQILFERSQLIVWDIERPGFDRVELRSSGDLRFLGEPVQPENVPDFLKRVPLEGQTSLYTSGDLLLSAERIYPGSHAFASVAAGIVMDAFGNPSLDPERTLRIERAGSGGDVAAAPSVFGALGLVAANVEQAGVVMAPLGMVQLGHASRNASIDGTSTVTLLPGSLTSVSAAGLVLPYGGTTDDVNYLYDGEAAQFDIRGSTARGVVLAGRSIDVQSDAVLDMSGGGELAGAGFISGRGGSVDARLHPLIQNDSDGGFVLPDGDDNPIYALVPGWTSGYAPVLGENGAGDPAIGQQITVPEGVPGLDAGTYTLLPSTYALLPGAFRVELHNGRVGTAEPIALRNGSWSVGVTGSIANTDVRDVLPVQATLTSADTLRRYSQYNETSYSEFARTEAARVGGAVAVLPEDGKRLGLNYAAGPDIDARALNFDGIARFAPAENGAAGQTTITTAQYGAIEILAPGAEPTEGFTGAFGWFATSIHADELSAIGTPSLIIGGNLAEGQFESNFGSAVLPDIDLTSPVRTGELFFISETAHVVVRNGASLVAREVFLASGGETEPGLIEVEPGARIDTLNAGDVDTALDGYVYVPRVAVLGVSNRDLSFLPPDSGTNYDTASGEINIGVCDSPPCAPVSLYSQGSIIAATAGEFNLGNEVRYGTRNLALAVSTINVGSAETLADFDARGALAPGLILSREAFSRLLEGDPETGAPALERLTLTAGESINFYGNVDLSTYDPATGEARLSQLVLNTPAIYGAGDAGARAVISTGTLYWNGVIETTTDVPNADPNQANQGIPVSAEPGAVVAGGAGTGQGILDLQVNEFVLGYAPGTRAANLTTLNRLALGFDTVNVQAAEQITANNKNTLTVYRSHGAPIDGEPQYSGGNLNLTTPLLTGESGSIAKITAGGALTVSAPAGADAAVTSDTLGAELSLAGGTVTVSNPIVLPSGKLTLSAQQDLILEDGARLDLAGREIEFFDVTRYSFGGDVVLESAAGNIRQSAGSSIDLSAHHNDAGSLGATALGEGAGRIDLAGSILGSTTGEYDAGGTWVPFETGRVSLRGQAIEDFAGLNARLNENSVFGARHFQIKQGDLVTGDEVRAHDIAVSVDGGSLTVNGRMDASGFEAGSIRLAARDNLIVNGALDAHGTGLRVDNYDQVIESPNRAIVELTAADGQLTLNSSAIIDLRAGTGADGQSEGMAFGTLDLNVGRAGADSLGDARIDVSAPVTVRGAKRIAVNAFRRYEVTDGVINQSLLDGLHGDSTTFIDAALSNAALQGRLAGLQSYGDIFHLRPGVELYSAGDLTVDKDLDLSGYRYGPAVDLGVRGSGEAGVLVVRAGGDLTINGSITDGFDLPPLTPDDAGWVITGLLNADAMAEFGGTLIGATSGNNVTRLQGGTSSTMVLGFDAPIRAAALNRGMTIPFEFQSRAALAVPAWAAAEGGWLATADIFNASGTLLYSAGARVSVSLPTGTRFAAGTVLPSTIAGRPSGSLNIQVVTAPTGTPLNVFNTSALFLNSNVTLPPGAVLSAGMNIVGTVPAGREPDVDGRQGRLYALAPMLPEGSESWSMRWAAGADLQAANARALATATSLAGSGNLTLDDTHYVNAALGAAKPAPSVVRTGTGDLELLAGGDFFQHSLYGIYTAGTPSVPLGGDDAAWNLPRGETSYPEVYRAWYPTGGGNVSVDVQGSLMGDTPIVKPASGQEGLVGDWLWRQGGGEVVDVATAWWINFGAYADGRFVTFSGIGTLGGGDVSVTAGGDAGLARAVNLAVGSTGRIDADGNLILTGGGDVNLNVGGQFNPAEPWWYGPYTSSQIYAAPGGTLTNLRGHIDARAGAIGGMELHYGAANRSALETRFVGAFDPVNVVANGGVAIVPGDAGVSLSARGDLVLREVVDPGRVQLFNTSPFTDPATGTVYAQGGQSWFTLWTPQTSIDLFGAGGNMMPLGQFATGRFGDDRPTGTDGVDMYPPNFTAAAARGNIFYTNFDGTLRADHIALAPSPTGGLELLATGSIIADQLIVSQSGAPWESLATPSRPAFLAQIGGSQWDPVVLTNASPNSAAAFSSATFPFVLSPFAPNTPTGDTSAYIGSDPVRFYAVEGDIVGLRTGAIGEWDPQYQALGMSQLRWYYGARPTHILAGRDIVGSGDPPPAGSDGFYSMKTTSNLFVHNGVDDVSVVRAGRDILESSFHVVGPGTLEITAGRNIYQGSRGEFVSHGLIPGVSYPAGATGADIAALAGVGAAGPDYAGLAARYLDEANQAELDRPLADQPGKVAQVYGGELTLAAWLSEQFGYTGDEAGAPAWLAEKAAELNAERAARGQPSRDLNREYSETGRLYLVNWLRERYPDRYDGTSDARELFATLPPEQQRSYLRNIYFTELKASGREYNDADGRRFGSYLRGREAIATLFPTKNTAGESIEYDGDFTLFSTQVHDFQGNPAGTQDSSIRTLSGGDIQILAPGGRILVGLEGLTPGGNAGLLTQGAGDIELYSEGSILLGLSRIMTTFGGHILGWSSEGDINAGRGAKTTLVYTPPVRVYDNVGNVALSPNVPSGGAGIATLNPIPEVPPGDVDLIAPLGTIDAGEAGIRVSGNVNLAALQVVNAANIQVQGEATGLPVIASVNVGALTNASAAAAQASIAAQDVVQRERASNRQALPSIFSVRVLGFGEAPPASSNESARNTVAPTAPQAGITGDPGSAFQVLGRGDLTPAQRARLTEVEQSRLRSGR